MMNKLAIIGGTGLSNLDNLEIVKREIIQTPYGEPSAPLMHGEIGGIEVLFLPRHGHGHLIPPHKVNYRANLWALKEAEVDYVLAIAAVGGIRSDLGPKALVVPDQIIDYTWSRVNTYFDEGLSQVTHIDFSYPYDEVLRSKILTAVESLNMQVSDKATYAATQGPRLETAAEIDRLERDGCDIVGMTGMPEACLARELDLAYACLAVVANEAAGRSKEELTMKMIEENLKQGMDDVRGVIAALLKIL